MELKDIPTHPIEPWMFPEAQELRGNAPHHLVSLIESGELGNITSIHDLQPSQVSALAGGEKSVCFYLENENSALVVKLRYAGTESEAQALLAWEERGLPVPKILSHGIVPGTGDQEKPVGFIIEEAILDADGNLSKAGHKFVLRNPEMRTEVARRLGILLSEIHGVEAPVELGFGGFADDLESGNRYNSFGEFLAGNLDFLKNTLLNEGFSPEELDSIAEAVGQIQFTDRAVYAHGDYGPHNALVKNSDPEDLVIFDPNPLLADPYWDIAPTINWLEIRKQKAEASPENEKYQVEYEKAKQYAQSFLSGYKAEAGEEFDEKRMDAIRFMRLVRRIDYDRRKENHPVEPKVFSKEKMQRDLEELNVSRRIMRDLGKKLTFN